MLLDVVIWDPHCQRECLSTSQNSCCIFLRSTLCMVHVVSPYTFAARLQVGSGSGSRAGVDLENGIMETRCRFVRGGEATKGLRSFHYLPPPTTSWLYAQP